MTPLPTPTANPALFPPFVAQHSVVFEAVPAVDLASHFPGIHLPETLKRAVPKRQTEYLAGRFCAREAIRSCMPGVADVRVGTGPHGEPLWPHGVVGAITHTHGFASAAVARRADARAIGLDAEQMIGADKVADLLETIASRGEIAALVRSTGLETAEVLTLVFSAKETIYKALYADVRRYFDFLDAHVDALAPSGSFEARLVKTLTPELRAGTRLEGRFERGATTVSTGMALPP